MKHLFKSVLLCVFVMVLRVHGDELHLDPKDAKEVREKLAGYCDGKLTLEDVSDGEEWGTKVIAFHLTRGTEVTTKMKLPIARCYAIGSLYSNAVQVVTEYLIVYTNDGRAWDVLAGARLAQASYRDSFIAGTNALHFGCERNVAATGFAALQIEQLDFFESVIAPRLLILKDDEGVTKSKRREMINILVAYSLHADKKEIFVKAIEGVDVKMLGVDSKLKNSIRQGCDHFTGKDVEAVKSRLFKAKDEQ